MTREWMLKPMVSTMSTTYWKEAWRPRLSKDTTDYAIITRKDSPGFFVSHDSSYDGCDPDDIGPFDSFAAAAACFEVVANN